MGSGIPQNIRIRNASSTDKERNSVTGIRNPQRGIQNPRLSSIHFLHEEYKGHSLVQGRISLLKQESRTSKKRGLSLDKQTDQKVRSNNNNNK